MSLHLSSKFPGATALRAGALTLVVLAATHAASPVQAQTNGSWNVNGSGNWSDGTKWLNGNIAGGGGAAVFQTGLTADATVTLDGAYTVGSLTFSDTDTAAAVNSWTVAGSGTNVLTLQTLTGGPTISAIADQVIIISARLGGTQGFTLSGLGTVRLSAGNNNSITGNINLTGGATLQFTNNSLNSTTRVVFQEAATLAWQGVNTQDLSSKITINDGVIATVGTGTNSVTFDTALQTGPAKTAGLLKNGTGTLTITAANDFTGLVRVRQGIMVLAGGDNRLSTAGTIALGQAAQAGTLQLGNASGASNQTTTGFSSAGAATASNRLVGGHTTVSTLTLNLGTDNTYGGTIGGVGTNENNIALVKGGSGTFTLTNANSTFTGGITLNQGAINFVDGALGSGLITFAGDSSLQWATGAVSDLSARIKINDGVTATVNIGTSAVTFATALQTGVAATGSVTKNGTGTLTITAQNTFTGLFRARQGRTVLAGGVDNHLSASGSIEVGQGANVGILQLGDASGVSNQTTRSLAGTTTSSVVGGNAAVSTLTVNNAATVTYAGLLGGTGTSENNLALVKTGAGLLTLSNAGNTFTGDVTVGEGTLAITHAGALGGGAKTITVSGTGATAPTFRINGTGGDISLSANYSFLTSNDDATAPAISNSAGNNIIAGTISLASGGFGTGHTRIKVEAGSLTINGGIAPKADAVGPLAVIFDAALGTSGVANGLLTDTGAVVLGVTKEGAGAWTLTQANSYTGATTVNGGRLNLTTAQTGGGAVNVADGATLGLSLAAGGQGLTTSTLTLNGTSTGATLAFDLGSLSNPSAALIQAGAFSVSGTGTIHLAGTGLGIGTFDLISYTGVIGGDGFAALTLGNRPARVVASLQDAVGKVQIHIESFDVPKWTGATDNKWDINDGADPTTGTGTVNWREANSNTDTRYLQTGSVIDSVLFDDSANGTGTITVDLTATLTPITATINNPTRDYAFTGLGKLSGATSVVKLGAGTLVFENVGENDYTGTTTISAGQLVLGNGVTAGAGRLGTGDVILNGTLSLYRPLLDDFTLANSISGSGTLKQQGGNTVTLSGNNATFSGAVLVESGVLRVIGTNALGTAAAGVTVQGTGVLELAGQSLADAVQLSSGGSLRAFSTTTNTVTNGIVLNGGGILDGLTGTTLTVSSAITGTGGLTKRGAGTVILTSELNDYAGGTVLEQGTLQFGASSGAGTTNVVPAGTIHLSPAAGNTATLALLRAGSYTFGNDITSSGAGTSALIIGVAGAASPSGIVTLSGANSFAGNIAINGGALKITDGGALGTGVKTVSIASSAHPALLLDGTAGGTTLSADIGFAISSDGTGAYSGAIVNLAGDNITNGVVSLINGGGGQGRLSVEAGSLTLNGNVNANGATGTTRTLLIGGAGNGFITGAISDFNTVATTVVSVTKDGSGAWTLSGGNTFTGAIAVQEGTLRFNTANASGLAQSLGTGTGAITLGTASSTGVLEFTGTADGTLVRPVTVGGVGGGILHNSGSATLTLAGTQTSNARPLTFTGGKFIVTGVIAGANAATQIIINGATVTLANGANTYNGTTSVIGGGTLKNGVVNALPLSAQLNLGESVDNTAGTYDLNGFDSSVLVLNAVGTGANRVTNSAASGTAALTISGTGIFTGQVQDGSTAATAFRKTGTGLFRLTGANTYSGTTTITAGILQVGDGTTTGSLGSGAVVNNATLRFNRINAHTVSNAISGSGTVVQAGTGTTTLTGASTYTGATQVTSGTLVVDGGLGGSLDGTAVSVSATAKFGIAGNTTLGGAVSSSITVATGGTLSLVDGGINTLTLAHSLGLTLNIGSTLAFDLSPSSGLNTVDGADVGSLSLLGGNSIVSLNILGGTGTLGNGLYTLLSYAGGSALNGGAFTFDGSSTVLDIGEGRTYSLVTRANSLVLSVDEKAGPNAVYWSGAVDGTWATVGSLDNETNWLTGPAGVDLQAVPGAVNDVFLTANLASHLNTTLGANFTVNSLTFTGGVTAAAEAQVTVTGNTLTIAAAAGAHAAGTGILVEETSSSLGHVLSSNIVLGADQSWTNRSAGVFTVNGATVTGAGRHLTVDGAGATVISASLQTGSGSVTKSGTGLLTLSGNNTYTGATFVNGGILRIGHANALGKVTAGTTIAGGSALELQGNIVVGAEPLTISGAGAGGTGVLRNLSGTNSFAGVVTLAADSTLRSDAGLLTLTAANSLTGSGFHVTLGGAGNLMVNGVISTGAGTLTKDGAGNVRLNGANTFTGNVLVTSGTLTAAHSGALGAAATANAIQVSAGASLELAGTVTLSAAKTLTITGQGAGNSGALRVLSGAGVVSGTVNLAGHSRIQVDAGSLTLGNATTAVAGPDTDLTLGGNGTLTVNGPISLGAGSLTKVGSGVTLLNKTGNYTGATTVNGGTLRAGAADSFNAAGAVTVNSLISGTATYDFNGKGGSLASLTFGGAGSTSESVNVVNLGAAGTVKLNGPVIYDATGGPRAASIVGTGSSKLELGATQTFTVHDSLNSLTVAELVVSAAIVEQAGSGFGIIKAGAGVLRLSGVNSFTGAVQVNAGTLSVGSASGLGAVDGGVVVASDASLEYVGSFTANAESVTITGQGATGNGALRVLSGAITHGGAVTLGGDSRIQVDAGSLILSNTGAVITGTDTDLVLAGGGNLTVNGAISLGDGGITKAGAGIALLNKASIYTGPTVVNGGTLRAGFAGAFNPAGAVTVNSLVSGTATYDFNGKGGALASLAIGGTGATSGSINVVAIGTAGTVALNGPVTYDNEGNPLGATISGSGAAVLDLGADSRTLDIEDSSTSTELALNVNVIGDGGIIKSGAGTLRLNGVNTFAGAVLVNGGTVSVGTASGLGAVTGGASVASGASLEYQGSFTANTKATLDLRGQGVNGSGALRVLSGAVTYGGEVHLLEASRIQVDAGTLTLSNALAAITGTDTDLALGGNGTLTVNGVISIGAGDLIKVGSGLTLLNKGNSYTGDTVVSGGILRAGADGAFNLAGTVTVNSVIPGTATYDFNGKSGELSSLTFGGLGGTASSINTVALGAAGTVALKGPVKYENDGNPLGASIIGTGTAALHLGSVLRTFDVEDSSGTSTELTLNVKLTGTDAGVTKTGDGTLLLAGLNTYTGATQVSGGILSISKATALGTVDAGTVVASGASLELQGNVALAAGETLSISGQGAGNSGALRSLSGTNSYAGVVTLGGDSRIQVDTGTFTLTGSPAASPTAIQGTDTDLILGGNGALTVNGAVTLGNGDLVKVGSGVLQLNKFNTYTGATVVNGGTLRVGVTGALGTTSSIKVDSTNNGLALLDFNGKGGAIPNDLVLGGTGGTSARNEVALGAAGTVTLGGDVIHDAGGNPLGSTISGSGAARLSLNGATRTFQVQNSLNAPTDLTITAVIQGTGLGIIKTGAGVLQLSAANLYTGTTTIRDGTLSYGVAGAINAASGVVVDSTANGTALLHLNGKGGVLASLTLGGTGGLTASNNVDLGTAGTTTLNGNVSYLAAGNPLGSTISGAGSARLSLGGPRTFLVEDSTNAVDDLTIGAILTGTGGITKAGAGNLLLNAANTNTGAFTVSGGRITYGVNGAIGAAGAVIVNAANNDTALLDLNDRSGTIASLTLGGTGGTTAVNNVSLGSSSVLTLNGNVVFLATGDPLGSVISGGAAARLAIAATRTFTIHDSLNAPADLTVNAVITGAGGITKNGAGNLVLSQASTNTGATTVNAGTLTYGIAGAINPASALTINATTVGIGAKVNLAGFGGAFASITFGGTGAVLNGVNELALGNAGTLTLSGAVTYVATNNPGGALISGSDTAEVALGGTTRTFTINNSTAAADLRISPILTGTAGLTKAGLGTLVLAGENSYTGITTVSAGVLGLANDKALGATGTGNTTTVASGASLQLEGGITVEEAVTVTGLGSGGTGALRSLSGDNTYTGAITVTGSLLAIQSDDDLFTVSTGTALTGTNLALTLAGDGDITLAHGISIGSGALTKNNAGTALISGAATHTGTTTVGGGTLRFAQQRSFGVVTINATTTSRGSAKLDLTGLGGTIGTLNFGGTGAGGGSENELALGNVGTLNLNGNVTYTATNNPGEAVISGSAAAEVALGAASRIFTIHNSTAVEAELTISPSLTGTAGLTKAGLGTLVLAGENTYSGTTTVSAGTLGLADDDALGETSAGNSTTVASGASLQLEGGITVDEAVTITGLGAGGTGALRNLSGDNTFTGALTVTGTTFSIQSDDDLLTIYTGTALTGINLALTLAGAGDITLAHGISIGSGALTKNNAGLAFIDGSASYTGATNIFGGTLRFAEARIFVGAVTIKATTSGGSAKLDLNGEGGTISSLTFGGTGAGADSTNELALGDSGILNLGGNVTYTATSNPAGALISGGGTSEINLGSLTRIFTVNNSASTGAQADLTISPALSGSAGVTKSGLGTLVLRGTNAYTGNTTVNQGNLQVGQGGVGRTGSGATTVAAGATISGTGRINGIANTTAHGVSGILSPGDEGGALNGTLSVDGNLTITASGSQLIFGITNATGVFGGNLADLDFVNAGAAYLAAIDSIATQFGVTAPGATTDHDYLVVDGILTLSGNTRITVNNLGGTLALGNVYNIIDADSIIGGGFSTGADQRGGGLLGDLFLPNLGVGLKWDTTRFLSHGLLIVVDPPVHWKGGSAADATSWSDDANWVYEDGTQAGAPGSLTEVVLSSQFRTANPAGTTLDQDITIKKLKVTDTEATTINGDSTLTIRPLVADGSEHEAITVNSGASPLTVNAGVSFSRNARITVHEDSTSVPGLLVLNGRVTTDSTLIKAGRGTLRLGSDAIVSIGAVRGASAESLQVILQDSGSLVLQGSTLEFDIFADGTSDLLSFTGGLNDAVTLQDVRFSIHAEEDLALEAGDTWTLIDWSGLNLSINYTGNIYDYFDLPVLQADSGLAWNLDRLAADGTISVAEAVPEPGRALLLVFGFAALFMRRRR